MDLVFCTGGLIRIVGVGLAFDEAHVPFAQFIVLRLKFH